ncbi:DUF512 domain-containing protein [Irregularibacter muris]|uniref:DUF512 domain-containing protein n=1 Tax=Irregularibacter muris TaxID=1796619 RepID=A0AAE3HD29_9FIRM|nr:DUF512 domain-containing protein [Irregularibacter muris]MCR1898195.1 DUF512 domain-containing protein [Irregularibacter muris]
MDNILIKEVKTNSIAEEAGIEPGDILISINGYPAHDIIEYKYLITDEELLLEIKKDNGEYWDIEIEKDYDEDLGLIFESAIIDKARGCHNKCIFCFIDQLPTGLRKTLYFKDDDTRLSFLQGNYVTLTNITDEEIERIIKYRIHPINISVHTSNPDLRKRMLNNKRADRIMEIISKFADAQLTMNTQIVLCPEINDGAELERTLKDLSQYHPWIKSITIVPVGISKHRQYLYPLREFTKEEAIYVINQISDFQEKMLKTYDTRFVFPGDEFFIKAGIDFPDFNYYEGFGQLENGVGMVTLFAQQFNHSINERNDQPLEKRFSIVTGQLIFPYMKELIQKISQKWNQIQINVFPIENQFFGEKITVSGLITGQDIVEQLKDKQLGEFVLMPQSMLKAEENIFLDDYTLDRVAQELKVPVYPIEVNGEELIKKVFE